MSDVKVIRYLHVGPGGMNCKCCFPARGKRKLEFRAARRREDREVRKMIAEEIHNETE